ncbi:hypothetical protein [Anabaenopsis elenkinii]|uniref:Uncharacterized protein n=1 Tax=Anabaenopsis elenkinii CCIBt3563 TaxID=2779889 RepID=A0A7U3RY23_9CYAN|nr:hypothetical protein [Anabaenopsis elenkinii]QOV21905.1 hypothetical protein IM676_14460 [Anabaenopsis elenkinii CCIBt3563]
MNSPSESKNPPKRIDENIEVISNRFQPISAISPEFDFRVGGDVQAETQTQTQILPLTRFHSNSVPS